MPRACHVGSPPRGMRERGSGRRGLTCAAVQEADASVIMGSDGEGLVRVTHHLVDLGWA